MLLMKFNNFLNELLIKSRELELASFSPLLHRADRACMASHGETLTGAIIGDNHMVRATKRPRIEMLL